MRFAHTNIVSKDWKALADFYVKIFHCKIVPPVRDLSGHWLDKGLGIDNAKLSGAHLLLPGHGKNGPTLEIFQYAEIVDQAPIPPHTRGFGHIAFEVENVESTLSSVIENGGSPLGEITEKEVPGAGYLYFVYVRDPDGNVLELQRWEKD